MYLFLWTYSCKECRLETFPSSSVDEEPNMLFLCWITSCNLPQAESLRRAWSGLPSLMITPVRPELIEYLRTVMTAFSVRKNMNTLHRYGFVFTTLKGLADGVMEWQYNRLGGTYVSVFSPASQPTKNMLTCFMASSLDDLHGLPPPLSVKSFWCTEFLESRQMH